MMRLALLLAVLAAPVASAAEVTCQNPPPIFHCADWHRDSEGRLASTRPVAAGLIEIGANSYLGDHTEIDGVDYAEALKKQCGP